MNVDEIESMSLEQLRARLAVRERHLKAVHDISSALFSHDALDTILRKALRTLLDVVEADAGSILLYDAELKKLIFRYVIGTAHDALMGVEIDVESEGKAATVFRTGDSILAASTSKENHTFKIDEQTGFHTESILTVALKNLDGSSLGVLQALNKRGGLFDLEDQDLLETVSSVAATVIANASLAQEAQLAAVARAVGDLGHDIKNALTPVETMVDTTIQAFVEPMYQDLERFQSRLSLEHPLLAEELNGIVEPLQAWYPEVQVAVKDGCSDIREMVSEIADYIKGAQATNFEKNSIAKVILERLRRLQAIAGNRRITLHINTEETVPDFYFDRRLVGRAVFNLVNNGLLAISEAVKKRQLELRPEGFNIWIRLSTVYDNDNTGKQFCEIEVKDDGPGIPGRVKDSLFTQNAISTTDGGTGIGTRFVKSVADAHFGSVGVVSEVGEGARFWMHLPLKLNEA